MRDKNSWVRNGRARVTNYEKVAMSSKAKASLPSRVYAESAGGNSSGGDDAFPLTFSAPPLARLGLLRMRLTSRTGAII